MHRILIALDVDSAGAAMELADRLRGHVGGFKIGSQLFTIEGPSIVRRLVERGDRVFLDLKFHDIPNTVAGASRAAAALGVWMFNVHASGGADMMRAARDAANEEGQKRGRVPLVTAVTVLTSLDEDNLAAAGVTGSLENQVERLAVMARAAGLDGVVASPREIRLIRARVGSDFLVVTPGIRGGAAGSRKVDDQARTLAAREAIDLGASYLVVGRPVTADPDPVAAATRMAAELGQPAK